MLMDVLYQTNERVGSGNSLARFRIVVDQEVIDFNPAGRQSNSPVGGNATIEVHIYSTAARDKGQVRPRGVILRWTGTPPDGYDSGGKIFVPVLRSARFAEYKVTDLATYKGASCIIVAKLAEEWKNK